MSFSRKVVLGLVAGLATGLFFGEDAAVLQVPADVFVRLLQMTVLPYVTLAIVTNIGSLSYARARMLGSHAGAVLVVLWAAALLCACAVPLAFPHSETGGFYTPSLAERPHPLNFVELYVSTNPFNALANSVVPAVVLFSVLVGVALIGVDGKESLIHVLQSATAAVGRVARFIVRLTPYGIFAIAAHAAGTLDIAAFERIQVYLLAYVAFALLLALWVLPGLIGVLTPISGRQSLSASREALITAFLVGDLFIVLPSLMASCSQLLADHVQGDGAESVRDLPEAIVPTSFTFPHAGKLLSVSFILFAGWYADSPVPLARYPELAMAGLFAFFGSMNVAVPFLLDMFRIPADTFQLFVATGVINSRFGTLVAAVHTIAVSLIGSTAIAGQLRVRAVPLLRFAVSTAVLIVVLVVGLRTVFAVFVDTTTDGRAVLDTMQPGFTAPVREADVITPAQVAPDTIPAADAVLAGIRSRGVLRVGLIGDGIPYAFRNDHGQLVGLDVEMALTLATDLGVTPQFVRFGQGDLDAQVAARTIDIVMTGARLTPERAAAFATSDVYLDETLALVTLDHRRNEFESWAQIRARGTIRLGVQNLPYYIERARAQLPDATLSVIPETAGLLDPSMDVDAFVLPAERGSVLTMLQPRYSVVIPDGARVLMPLAYPLAGSDPSWIRYVNTWIALKKKSGFVDLLYQHWILGQGAERHTPRWSIKRDVLGWGVPPSAAPAPPAATPGP